MLTTISLGVLSSLVAEVITWINKKLSGTVLKGDGAFLLAAFVALIGGAFQVWHAGIPLTNLDALWVSFVQIWAVSQVFFLGVVQMFGLDVQPTTA
jgi:hypothetical protein